MLIVFLALGRLWWLPAHASLNINEGWNAGHVARAFGPGSLYPAPDALQANNYPPLSFLVLELARRLVGDTVVAGRIVSLISQVAVGGAIYVIVARLTASRRWAIAGAMLFAGFGVTVLRPYLAMNDPQWLAQAALAWAMVLIVPRALAARAAPEPVLAAATLIVLAVLIKHNIVAVPLAATIWLWFADRRALAIWIATGALLATVAGAVLFGIWGSTVFTDVLAPARSYSALRMLSHGVPLLLFVAPGALAARPLVAASRDDRRLLLPLLLVGTALPIGIIQRSGDGVDVNAIFDTAFALTIAVATGCALRPGERGRWFALATVPALALVPVAASADLRELIGRDAAVRHWRPFTARIAAARGPVACDDQAVCYWAGRQSALDFFALKQRLLKGDVPALRQALDRHEVTLIAMRGANPGWHENRLIPTIRARYRTVYAEGGSELLVPR